MRPVLTASQIREADAHTIQQEPVRSIDLMERAATAVFDWIFQHAPGTLFPKHSQEAEWRFAVCCGPGNNGGDGLVVARSLARSGYTVSVIVVEGEGDISADFEENMKRVVKAKVPIVKLGKAVEPPSFEAGTVLIDALFGTGLTRPLTGIHADLVRAMNGSGCTIVSIDMPSGLGTESCVAGGEVVVRAAYTLTFELPKLAFFFRENAPFVGHWQVLPIGLDHAFITGLGTPWHVVEHADALSWMQPRSRSAHKGDHGHALLMGGASDKMGAALLATGACLRSGVGLVTVALPSIGLAALNARHPEAMAHVDPDKDRLTVLPPLERYTAVGIGPGMGTDKASANVLKLLIQEAGRPLVIDADALNILAANPTWLAFLPANTVLTPHPGEFDRLAGASGDSASRLEKAREFARRFGVHLVLKGASTAICDPQGRVRFNPTGNPGMAKGGSGDALTGVLTGLLAQGLPLADACALAVYAHGLAGDIAAGERGMDGMTVTDLIGQLPTAWQQLRA